MSDVASNKILLQVTLESKRNINSNIDRLDNEIDAMVITKGVWFNRAFIAGIIVLFGLIGYGCVNLADKANQFKEVIGHVK